MPPSFCHECFEEMDFCGDCEVEFCPSCHGHRCWTYDESDDLLDVCVHGVPFDEECEDCESEPELEEDE